MNEYVGWKEDKEILVDSCRKNEEVCGEWEEERVCDFCVFGVGVGLFVVVGEYEGEV